MRSCNSNGKGGGGDGVNYYNDNDPHVCRWLMRLIEDEVIPMGKVDNRSIADVQPEDLEGYTQVHLFAGIAGWAYALDLAGVPPDTQLWTGSCPCQPFSSAGQRKGHADRRHLWPAFQHLIAECKPPTIFGEQVASKDGREWLSAVRTDLERMGYACGCADLPAAGVGAPHIRQRLWWVAHSHNVRCWSRRTQEDQPEKPSNPSHSSRVGHSNRNRPQGRELRTGLLCKPNDKKGDPSWSTSTYVLCADGKERPVEPSIPPLAHGVPGRVGRLRAYGDSIVPSLAAKFIQASMEAIQDVA